MSEEQQPLSNEEKDQYFVTHREDPRGPWRGLGCVIVIMVAMALIGGIVYAILKARGAL